MIIKHIYHNILRWYRKARIKNKEITIISNNCWGGLCISRAACNTILH